MGITAEILDNLLWTAEWGLGIDDPFALPKGSGKSPEGLGLSEIGDCAMEGQLLLIERLLERFQKQAPEKA